MNIRTTLRKISVLSLLVGAIGLLGPAAEAKPRWHPRHHGHGQRHHGRVIVRQNVVVPQTIVYRSPGPYARFYSGRAYYAPHHHYHRTYTLPVVVNGYVVDRPYDYCGGHLFVRASAPRPHLAFDFVFGDNPYGSVHYDSGY